jgi:hypothetical protein
MLKRPRSDSDGFDESDDEGQVLTSAFRPKVREVQEVEDLNRYLERIIEGSRDDTIPPDENARVQREQLSRLNDEINAIIARNEQEAEERERARAAAARAAMAEQEKAQIIAENLNMMNEINAALARSAERLSRTQRIELNNRIISLITNTVTAVQINDELAQDSGTLRENIRGLFNSMIEYYTEMASYGYERSPYILANMGSIVAGTAMLGSAIVAPANFSGQGGILMFLSRYLGTATVTASGLFFLQRGGLNVTGLLEQVGSSTLSCLQEGCRVISKGMITGFESLIQMADDHMDNLLSSHDDSSQGSVLSSGSTASSASQSIKLILGVPEREQIAELLNPSDNQRSASQGSAISGITASQGFGSQIPNDFGDEIVTPGIEVGEVQEDKNSDIDGGRKRKSRRYTKVRKSRKGRKGRKGRVTKKGRKHHKTLKRYRSKTRR